MTDTAASPPAPGAKILRDDDVASEHGVDKCPRIDISIHCTGNVSVHIEEEGEKEEKGEEGEDAGMTLPDHLCSYRAETYQNDSRYALRAL